MVGLDAAQSSRPHKVRIVTLSNQILVALVRPAGAILIVVVKGTKAFIAMHLKAR